VVRIAQPNQETRDPSVFDQQLYPLSNPITFVLAIEGMVLHSAAGQLLKPGKASCVADSFAAAISACA
jgi:hypothetical protein